ncbi:hypothetical protein [Streptomyces sp. NPDC101206]|uniref:hypothetical protein n=1 Tax=Streptomyces sp. NPDC101206 TaxID=3366128 RepID=UPI003816C1C3
MITYPTANGGSIDVTPVDTGLDLHVRDHAGRTLATVVMPRSEALLYLSQIKAEDHRIT